MFPATVTLFFAATGFISVASGNPVELRSTHAAAVKCLQTGFNVEGSDIQSAEGGHIDKTAEKQHATCLFFEGMAPCLLRYAGPSPSTNEDLLNFLVAFDWQHIVLGTKSGVCNNVPYVADLRRIALESGIMEKENLVNIEDDRYEPCAGDAVRNCYKEDEINLETHIKDYNKNNAGFKAYMACFEHEADTCAVPMLQHFIAVLKAFKRHMDIHQGEFEEKWEQIEPKL